MEIESKNILTQGIYINDSSVDQVTKYMKNDKLTENRQYQSK